MTSTGRIASTRVSTGQSGYRTPTGVYSVIGKSRYHRSNIYSGAPMPWMQRITWSGIAMHAGVVPGYPASHGCIRLPYSVRAAVMFNLTKMGARVVVASRDTAPVDFAHDFLPLPKMQPRPPPADTAGGRRAAVKLASMGESEMTTAAVPETATPRAAQSDRLCRGAERQGARRQGRCRSGRQGRARRRPGRRRRSASGRR